MIFIRHRVLKHFEIKNSSEKKFLIQMTLRGDYIVTQKWIPTLILIKLLHQFKLNIGLIFYQYN